MSFFKCDYRWRSLPQSDAVSAKSRASRRLAGVSRPGAGVIPAPRRPFPPTHYPAARNQSAGAILFSRGFLISPGNNGAKTARPSYWQSQGVVITRAKVATGVRPGRELQIDRL